MKAIIGFLLFVAFAAAAFGADQPAKAVVSLVLATKSPVAGSKVKGTLKITFADGLHAYQNPPSKDYMIPLVVKCVGKGFKLVSAQYPKGVARKSGGEVGDVLVYEGTIEVPIVILVPVKAGPAVLKMNVSYQTCTEADCYPPEDVTVVQKLTLKPAKAK